MEVEIVEIKEEEKEVLLNLIEKYLYEFSQWEKTDVNVEGNYGYEYLDCYFEEENRYPYFIKVDGKLAGFAMISDYPEVPEETTDYCLSELFVMHKYRRGGVGRKAVNSVLDKHHGKWQLKRHPHNTVSVKFSNDFEKGKNQNKLSAENIETIISAYRERKDIPKYAHLASIEEIRQNEYNLNIPRYVDTTEEEEEIDINEVRNLLAQDRKEIEELEKQIEEQFKLLGI